jgi:cytochrome c
MIKQKMFRRPKLIYANVFTLLFLYVFVNLFNEKSQQENNAPVVQISSPENNSAFDFDTPVNYTINISDKEDGDSKYDEINAKEVLLEVRHAAKLPAALNKGAQPDPPGIAVMRISNCFNCHNFNGKSIGPSWYEINKKYPATNANTDTLVKHIREGSSGAWGKEKMPTHTELPVAEIKSTVQWILKHAADPGVNYYIGLGGSFRIKPPAAPRSNDIYVLTASYVDHGSKSMPGKQRLRGQDVVVLHGR